MVFLLFVKKKRGKYEFLFQCIGDTSNLENPSINCLNYRNHLSRFFTATLLSFPKALPQVKEFSENSRDSEQLPVEPEDDLIRFLVPGNLLYDAVLLPQQMELPVPLLTQVQGIASFQIWICFSIFIQVGCRI